MRVAAEGMTREEKDDIARLKRVFGKRATKRFKLRLPHHKTSSRGITQPVMEIVSHKLCLLIALWLRFGRPLLVGDANVDTLFMHRDARGDVKAFTCELLTRCVPALCYSPTGVTAVLY